MLKKSLGTSETPVSELCLGTMYFGTKMDTARSFEILDAFVDAGGNFIDTANNYCYWNGGTGNESEELLAQWMSHRKNRNRIILASKIGARPLNPRASNIEFEKLSKESILNAVNDSLKRLNTEYLDVCYIHADFKEFPLEERLEALELLEKQGRIRLKGCSNITTDRFLDSETINQKNDFSSFQAVQQKFSYLLPEISDKSNTLKFLDKELISYAEQRNISLLTYSVLLSGAYAKGWGEVPVEYLSSENKVKFEKIKQDALELGCTPSQWVLRWVMKQSDKIIPLIAASNIEQLLENIGGLSFQLELD
jgi:aryl-alcohol dehydrogenase-like predicted oxidoreductase